MLPALYHAHHNRHLEDLPFWLSLASQAGDPILELGCGTGRVLLPLARAGHRCFGLDRDLAMLDFLQSHAELDLPHRPLLFAADISQFRLAQRFQLILLPCNTFSTLEVGARQACLALIREHLVPGGSFALSLPNPELLRHLPAHSDPEIEEEFIFAGTGNPLQVSSAWQHSRDTFRQLWIYDQLFPDGSVERKTMEATHYRIPVNAAVGAINTAGMRVVGTFGDYDRSPYSSGSLNLILLAVADRY